VIDFSMQDQRNFASGHANYFVPNIDYQSANGLWKKVKQGASLIHSPVAVNKIEKLIVQHKPQIAHLHNIYHQLTPSIIPVLKKHGVKTVLTLHDYKLICPSYLALKNEEICNACQGRHFLKPLLINCQNSRSQELLLAVEAFWHKWRKSYDGIDCFISPSQFLSDTTSIRIPKTKLKVLHNGIDTSNYQPNYGDKGYALYFGRLSKEKGIGTLLKAHEKLPESITLKVVGTGPLADGFQRAYPKAIFMGYQSGQALNDLISNAAFVVVPSEWYENCSMVVLETMAFGKPIIGSRVGGIPEQIDDGKTGFLYEMGNVEALSEKMLTLWNDSPLRKKMGIAARQKLEEEYALEKHCNGLLSIYENLLENR
jgi:glycosyltransferase involved in cell wall biosynthesis